MRIVLLSACLVVATTCGLADTSLAQPNVVVPFGDGGWRYMDFPGSVPPEAWTIEFDDSTWPVGKAPFVGPDGCVAPGTLWLGNRTLFRKRIFWSGPYTLVDVDIRLQRYALMYWNGREILGANENGACPVGEFNVHSGAALRTGENVVAIFVTHFELPGLFDMRVSGDGVTDALHSSWGRLKLMYR